MSITSKGNNLALSLSGVSRNFGGIRAVADISFDVSHGKRLTIIGTNGAGKSTLFNLITGVYPLSSGSIHIFGEDVSKQPAHQRAGAAASGFRTVCADRREQQRRADFLSVANAPERA